jgi:hypothetical protein
MGPFARGLEVDASLPIKAAPAALEMKSGKLK